MDKKFIYLCGPTVYDKVHIGNLRPIITFDIFIKALKFFDKNIFFIHNLTDVDDKIINRAKELKTNWKNIANKYTDYYLNCLKELNINSIDSIISVTESMEDIKSFIFKLIKNKNTYTNNSIYFDTSSISDYGLHSNLKIENNFNSEDDKNSEKKKNQDFALWKKDEEFNYFCLDNIIGRPGWHSECAAFIYKYTNKPLYIHGGGIDLKFPHHENERAQFKALTNNELAKNWVYIGIVNLNGQKMSKSDANILSYDDFMSLNEQNYHNSDILKLIYFLSSYKSEINFTQDLYNNAFNKLMTLVKIRNSYFFNKDFSIKEISLENDFQDILKKISELKFSEANKLISEKIKLFNKNKDLNLAKQIIKIFQEIGFNFSQDKRDSDIINLYSKWTEHLDKKNYNEADKLRDKLIKKGILPYGNR